MSRKNLSRTVIEGGRYHRNSWDRRQSHGDERASTRTWLRQAELDSDVADERVVPPRRRVHREFRDKLAPAHRWLAAQVGRPWNKVYAELRAQFDSRTIAGAHVVNDHMLGWVTRNPVLREWWSRPHFVVDAHGILRRDRFYGAGWNRLADEAKAFARGRRAASTYRGWWWFRSVGAGGACRDATCRATHTVVDEQRYHATRLEPERAMTRGELRRLDRLHPYFRDRIVMPAP